MSRGREKKAYRQKYWPWIELIQYMTRFTNVRAKKTVQMYILPTNFSFFRFLYISLPHNKSLNFTTATLPRQSLLNRPPPHLKLPLDPPNVPLQVLFQCRVQSLKVLERVTGLNHVFGSERLLGLLLVRISHWSDLLLLLYLLQWLRISLISRHHNNSSIR